MDEDDDEIVTPTNLKKQTIPVTIYHIQKQLKFIHILLPRKIKTY
jgi:hypothetical protein